MERIADGEDCDKLPLLLLLTLLLLLRENQCFLDLDLRSLLGPLKEKMELASEAPQEVGLEVLFMLVLEKEEDMVVWLVLRMDGGLVCGLLVFGNLM